MLQGGTNYHNMYFGLVLVAPTFCHYIAYWCLLVKTHRLETKKHQLSFFMVSWAAQCVSSSKQEKHHNAWQTKNKKTIVLQVVCASCSKQIQINTMYTLSCLRLHLFLALYCLMVVIHETRVTPSSGKVKTKRHLFSFLVLADSECCAMCQLLQAGTIYHNALSYSYLLPFSGIILLDGVY